MKKIIILVLLSIIIFSVYAQNADDKSELLEITKEQREENLKKLKSEISVLNQHNKSEQSFFSGFVLQFLLLYLVLLTAFTVILLVLFLRLRNKVNNETHQEFTTQELLNLEETLNNLVSDLEAMSANTMNKMESKNLEIRRELNLLESKLSKVKKFIDKNSFLNLEQAIDDKIKAAENRIIQLLQISLAMNSDKVEKVAQPEPQPEEKQTVNEDIIALYKKGFKAEEISKQLKITKTKVELVLSLREL